MNYTYFKKIGGTDGGINLICPKCKTEEVVIIVLEDGCYGIKECKKCGYKNEDVYDHLNGKSH